VKITPVLLNPVPPAAAKPRQAVVAVERLARADDATGQAERRSNALPTDTGADVRPLEGNGRELTRDSRANRALGAYAEVADEGRRNSLRQLLGFDAYA